MSLVRQLVSIDWRLSRVVAVESRTLDREIDIQAPTRPAGARSSTLDLIAQAQQSLVERSRLSQFLARRESQLLQARLATLGMLEKCAKCFHAAKEPLNPLSINWLRRNPSLKTNRKRPLNCLIPKHRETRPNPPPTPFRSVPEPCPSTSSTRNRTTRSACPGPAARASAMPVDA